MSRDSNGGPCHRTTARYSNSRRHYNNLLTNEEACSKLQALGFEHTDKVPTSGKGRIPARGKNRSNTSASVIWTADGQALHWYEFTTECKGTIFAGKQSVYDRAEAARQFRKAESKRRQDEAVKQASRDRAARQAQDLWRAGAIKGTHGYINLKQLSGLHNARIDRKSGALLIPMWVSGGELVNLQQIFADGWKPFLSGGRVKGAYSVIGSLNNAECVIVSEGWATGASLFELFNLPVVIALSAGNLKPVCLSLRSRFSDISVIVAVDDDRQETVNVGRQKAIQAAEATGATLLFPELCQCCTCTDHNDAMVCRRRCGRGRS